MTPELAREAAAVWLAVSLKCIAVYVAAWVLCRTLARSRPAWQAFVWTTVLASFGWLTLLEWTAGSPSTFEFGRLTDARLLIGVHAYLLFALILLGLTVHSAVRLNLLRPYSVPLEVVSNREGPVTPPELPTLLQGIAVYSNRRLAVPTSFGILRPAIILPGPPAGAIYRRFTRAALVHELVKVLRFDALWTLLARLVQCAYFAHPLVWFAFRRYCLAREQTCDRWTVRTTGDTTEYATHLAVLPPRSGLSGFMAIDAPMAATGAWGIRTRISALDNHDRPESLPPWSAAAATIAWLFLLAGLASISFGQPGGGLAFHWWPMLLGLIGALTTGAGLTGVILVAGAHRARLAPPVDGLAGRSRQTLTECLERLEREWRGFRVEIWATARRFEPLLLLLIVVAATVSLWLISTTGRQTERPAVPMPEARVYDF